MEVRLLLVRGLRLGTGWRELRGGVLIRILIGAWGNLNWTRSAAAGGFHRARIGVEPTFYFLIIHHPVVKAAKKKTEAAPIFNQARIPAGDHRCNFASDTCSS